MSDFAEQVWQAVRRVPRGRVTTYAWLARAVGRPKAARAVGNALNHNPNAPKTPCHRVVRSDGQIGGYAHGQAAKARILTQEGIRIGKKNKVDNFRQICYKFPR